MMRVECDWHTCHGRPRVPGTRLAVGFLAEAAQGGMSREDVQRNWSVPRDWLDEAWNDLQETDPLNLGWDSREDPLVRSWLQEDGTWAVGSVAGEPLVRGITKAEAKAVARAIHRSDDDGSGWTEVSTEPDASQDEITRAVAAVAKACGRRSLFWRKERPQ